MNEDPARVADSTARLLALGGDLFAREAAALAAALADYRAAAMDATRGALWSALANAHEIVDHVLNSRPEAVTPELLEALADIGSGLEAQPES